jgi:glycosyltransferase involved in cell wall biosynthesis
MTRSVDSEPAQKPSVAVAIPAYNEAEGIGGFVREIERALLTRVSRLWIVVIDDDSTDRTRQVIESLRPELSATLEVVSNPANRGHGPSVLEGYRLALAHDPDYVLQVDGDGQFHGSDLRRLLVLLIDDAHAVSGVRRFRQDPWFRMVMTRLLRGYVHFSFGVAARDPNCPLRGYEAALLEELLAALPDECLIPNLYLTVVASRRGVALLEVDVSHRVRRGGSAEGTTWKRGPRSPIPWRLVQFSIAAMRESRSFRAQMDKPGWAR